ncbi:hypothetical protein K461DRAFT_241932 [Myriangium duriaei CBS 260.36]|uniref:Cwf19-like C-terminal domain-containing protein n=1 Tax=Myriangium duriaei CBS 260.36 TaxID=1168546 RepID=A0A9P4J593_9PEZI|nr:hypothetical protein K461DRAFT_241932 [Myriangium duriaei CBS 260.36]
MAAKIAVVGSVNGQLSAVFAKLATLHAKNQFAFAIIAGDLFGDGSNQAKHTDDISKLLAGKIEVPLTTYFALRHNALPAQILDRLKADEEICPNLHFLGRRTTFKTTEGIRIVALGGAHEPAQPAAENPLDEYSPNYSDTDAKVLRGATNADILITSDWPKGVTTGSSTRLTSPDGFFEQPSVADLCSVLKPRYHFSSGDTFYEREPFFHVRQDDTAGYQTTRFLSLAPYGNATKQKWIYAFSLDTKAILPATIPSGTTASPLEISSGDKKRKAKDQPQSFSRFGTQNGNAGHRSNKKARGPPAPSECFFCLSNPNAATHLITSIGDNAYLTTAKGPLSTSTTFSALDFPGHMLIIPLEHSPSASAITDTDSRRSTINEMRRYRRALQTMISNRSKTSEQQLGAVTWEIARAGGIHFHQQVMPVDRETITKGLVEAAFKVQAENESYPRFESQAITKDEDEEEFERQDYFRVWIADCAEDGPEETQLTLYLDAGFRFDLQFPRKVLAKLLGLEGRMDWRNCGQSEAEEVADAEAFKVAFKEWDFALDD